MKWAYSSKSFETKKRGHPWKWMFLFLIVGFVAGIIVDQAATARKPIELIVSTSPTVETIEETDQQGLWSASGNISVSAPLRDARVKSPLVVEGVARTFESTVIVRLKDAGGNELTKVVTTSAAPDAGLHGPYQAELVFETPSTRAGVVEVFQQSAKDGIEIDKVIDKVTVPIRFE